MRRFGAILLGLVLGLWAMPGAGSDENPPGLRVSIDLSAVKGDTTVAADNAARARSLLTALRSRFGLGRFEFTRAVRIAPYRIPHSHPVLTVNTRWIDDEDRFLSTYLHEQMHWYLSDHRNAGVGEAIMTLKTRYPVVPPAESQGARDTHSIYLHLVVNWLEIAALGQLIGLDRAKSLFDAPVVYPWIYETVIRDWNPIGTVLEVAGVLPMLDARRVVAP